MKLAIIFDDLIQFGGAERLLLDVHEIWPDAPIYTSVISRKWREICVRKKIKVHTSFMQYLPFVSRLYKVYSALYFHVLAFESFNLNDYDMVLSISARYAHMVVTKPQTKHICYMNSPGRMFWESSDYFATDSKLRLLLSGVLSFIRMTDYISAHRIDCLLSNSQAISQKVKRYYGIDSCVIYPSIDTSAYSTQRNMSRKHFLIISRLVSWKRIDIAIKACNDLALPLVIVGGGPDLKRLTAMAGPTVTVRGFVSDEEKYSLLANSYALIHTQKEDFGLTPLEAMASGKPVIAYGAGGALETVVAGKTGEFFYDQTSEALKKVLSNFDPSRYSEHDCRLRALNFDKKNFQRNISNVVSTFLC